MFPTFKVIKSIMQFIFLSFLLLGCTASRPLTSAGAPPTLSAPSIEIDSVSKSTSQITTAVLRTSEPETYHFGTVTENTFVEKDFVVSNVGSGVASEIRIEIVQDSAFFISSENCSSKELPAGRSCTIKVKFTPTQAINFDGSLSIFYQNGTEVSSIRHRLTGNGTVTPVGHLTVIGPSVLDFGNQETGSATTLDLLLLNDGAVEIPQPTYSGLAGSPFSINSTTSCPSTLSKGTSCFIKIDFKPTTPSVFSKLLQITFFDGVNFQTIAGGIKGSAFTRGTLYFVPMSLSTLPSQKVYQCMEVTNNSAGTVSGMIPSTLTSPFSIEAPGSVACPSAPCNQQLSSGQRCSYTFSFFPTASGSFSSPFQVSFYDGTQPRTAQVNLTGDATVQTQTFAPPTYVDSSRTYLLENCSPTMAENYCKYKGYARASNYNSLNGTVYSPKVGGVTYNCDFFLVPNPSMPGGYEIDHGGSNACDGKSASSCTEITCVK